MKDTKKALANCEARVLAEEENTASIVDAQKKVEAETAKFRGEMKKLEAEVAKCEEDKASKDSQIATLGEEVQHQNELISKLQKEKVWAQSIFSLNWIIYRKYIFFIF